MIKDFQSIFRQSHKSNKMNFDSVHSTRYLWTLNEFVAAYVCFLGLSLLATVLLYNNPFTRKPEGRESDLKSFTWSTNEYWWKYWCNRSSSKIDLACLWPAERKSLNFSSKLLSKTQKSLSQVLKKPKHGKLNKHCHFNTYST